MREAVHIGVKDSNSQEIARTKHYRWKKSCDLRRRVRQQAASSGQHKFLRVGANNFDSSATVT